MRTDHLFRTLKVAPALLVGAFLIACDNTIPEPEPEPDPQPPVVDEKPVLHNYSSAESSDVKVVSYDQAEGELMIEVPEDKIPKVGDIICSGVTEEAPYGYLFKVGSVTVSNTKSGDDITKKYARIAAGSATAFGLFQDLGINVKQWFDLWEEKATFSDDEGHTIDPLKGEDGESIFSVKVPIRVSDLEKIEYTHELSVPKLSVYLDTKTINMVFGYDVLFKNYDLLHINLKAKFFESKGDLIQSQGFLSPKVTHVYEFAIGPVPIVVTTVYKPTIPYEVSLSGNLDMDVYKKVTYHHMGGYYHAFSNTFTPLEGYSDFVNIFNGSDEGEYSYEYSDREFSATIEGKASFGVDFGYSVGLYGGNLFDKDGDHKTGLNYLSIGANGGVKLEEKMSLGGMKNIDENSHNAIRMIDDNKFTSYVYGKIWGSVLSSHILGGDVELVTGEKEWQFLKTEFYWPFFISSYSDLKVNEITHQGFINVTGKKHKPVFLGTQWWMFDEKEYGLCLESFDGLDYYEFNMNGHPLDERSGVNTGTFNFDIPVNVSDLRPKVKYNVYPYCRVSNYLLFDDQEKMFYRDGISFTVSEDGQVSTSAIDDVPGEQL